jgi:hypothetical protein
MNRGVPPPQMAQAGMAQPGMARGMGPSPMPPRPGMQVQHSGEGMGMRPGMAQGMPGMRPTAPMGPQQVGGSGGLAPWLRQGTAPLQSMQRPPQVQAPQAPPPGGSPPGAQLGQGQAAILAQQRQLADELRAQGQQTLAQQAQQKATDQSIYDQAWKQQTELGGVMPDVYGKLSPAQQDQLRRQVLAQRIGGG